MSESNKISSNNQPDLLEPVEGECKRAPMPLENSAPLDDDGRPTLEKGKGRRGRPLGSVNKKSLTLQKYLMALGYTHPAVILAEITARPVEELASHLRCKRLEAFEVQRKAASDLLPYFEGRILPKTDEGEQPLPQLHIHMGDDQVSLSGRTDDQNAPILVAEKIEEDQVVSYSEIEKSHDDKSRTEPSN